MILLFYFQYRLEIQSRLYRGHLRFELQVIRIAGVIRVAGIISGRALFEKIQYLKKGLAQFFLFFFKNKSTMSVNFLVVKKF